MGRLVAELIFAGVLVLLVALRPRAGAGAQGADAAMPPAAGAEGQPRTGTEGPTDAPQPGRGRGTDAPQEPRASDGREERGATQGRPRRDPSTTTPADDPRAAQQADEAEARDAGRMRPGELETTAVPFRRDSIFKGGDVSQKARMTRFARQPVPDSLVTQGIEGTVRVRYVVDTLGRAEPNSIRILQSPHPGFERPALRAIRESRFRAARKNGVRVRQEVEQDLDFVIDRTN